MLKCSPLNPANEAAATICSMCQRRNYMHTQSANTPRQRKRTAIVHAVHERTAIGMRYTRGQPLACSSPEDSCLHAVHQRTAVVYPAHQRTAVVHPVHQRIPIGMQQMRQQLLCMQFTRGQLLCMQQQTFKSKRLLDCKLLECNHPARAFLARRCFKSRVLK